MEILHWSARLRRIWDNLFTSRYERHLREEIEELERQRDHYRMKCERVEAAMLAGQKYLRDPQPPPKAIPPRSDTWAGIQAEHQQELEASEKEKKPS